MFPHDPQANHVRANLFTLLTGLNRPLRTIRSHDTKSHVLRRKSVTGTSKTKQLVPVHLDLPLFWKSHCATCVHACDFVPCDRIVQRAYSEKDSCGVVFIDEEFLKSKLQNLQHYKLWIVSGIRSSPGVIALFRPQEQPGLALENRRTVSYSPRQRTLSERLEYFDPQTGTEMLPCAPT